jgi:hypothetical protein
MKYGCDAGPGESSAEGSQPSLSAQRDLGESGGSWQSAMTGRSRENESQGGGGLGEVVGGLKVVCDGVDIARCETGVVQQPFDGVVRVFAGVFLPGQPFLLDEAPQLAVDQERGGGVVGEGAEPEDDGRVMVHGACHLVPDAVVAVGTVEVPVRRASSPYQAMSASPSGVSIASATCHAWSRSPFFHSW